MSRGRVLPLFALCAMALIGVMAWLSLTVRRLEQAERRSREEAALEETVRLALWRMESQLAPLIAQESAYPHDAYSRPLSTRLASVLSSSPYVRLRFQFDAQGRFSSPQVPERAREKDVDRPARELLARASRAIDRPALVAQLPAEWLQVEPVTGGAPAPSASEATSGRRAAAQQPREAEQEAQLTTDPAEQQAQRQQAIEDQSRAEAQRRVEVRTGSGSEAKAAEPVAAAGGKQEALQQQTLSKVEYFARSASNFINLQTLETPEAAPPRRSPPNDATAEVRVGRLQPVWASGELLLARRLRVGSQERIQVCWLDWPALRSWLLTLVSDLLPAAELAPVAGRDADETRRLAALPVRLLPGRMAPALGSAASGLRLPIAAAWVLAFVALAASAALLFGMATLSERRAAFVSAVTHELRTPLTTFRIYSDMLLEGMVESEEQRREYLTTLSRQAERQSHLVENVLAYSRLERGRYTAARETLTVERLLAEVAGSLAAHAEQSGMSLETAVPAEVRGLSVRVDRSAVERIFFNLVDNACKYARTAADRRIHLDCTSDARAVRFTVSDHGPGVDAREARRLFRPFHKSARDAAQSAPGVGLGLALSRRLARALGGELCAVRTGAGGAAFCLRLPRQREGGAPAQRL